MVVPYPILMGVSSSNDDGDSDGDDDDAIPVYATIVTTNSWPELNLGQQGKARSLTHHHLRYANKNTTHGGEEEGADGPIEGQLREFTTTMEKGIPNQNTFLAEVEHPPTTLTPGRSGKYLTITSRSVLQKLPTLQTVERVEVPVACRLFVLVCLSLNHRMGGDGFEGYLVLLRSLVYYWGHVRDANPAVSILHDRNQRKGFENGQRRSSGLPVDSNKVRLFRAGGCQKVRSSRPEYGVDSKRLTPTTGFENRDFSGADMAHRMSAAGSLLATELGFVEGSRRPGGGVSATMLNHFGPTLSYEPCIGDGGETIIRTVTARVGAL
ncbi:uncharacterized protein BO96DRAFT_430323 [Aspergillus niger CBS 101883]|uniref:uncharacterized protein n=1 Tax=Aspergillus lacticoffeatus (strain CBS 101883) TaxID=1450533 RepID=UPI000D7FE3A0|nr:uncharacterized protein BO96DRAFT_430323 [Aspergillus niger CBS 101883]PYH60382.1 hypothetical protein BO96DRAFT_430323 [Aspergillus niger CBS 101883]